MLSPEGSKSPSLAHVTFGGGLPPVSQARTNSPPSIIVSNSEAGKIPADGGTEMDDGLEREQGG